MTAVHVGTAQEVLRRRAEAIAIPAVTRTTDAGVAVVVVSVGDGGRYAFPATAVRQVLHGVTPAPLPAGCGALVGLVTTRGQVVPVADLAALVSGAAGRPARSYVVVLDDPVQPLGLLVDEVDTVELPALSTSRPAAAGDLGLGVGTLGILAGGIVLLDTDDILDDQRLSVPRRRQPATLPATDPDPPGAT